ncbi:MAG: hypothetical protein CMO55_11310 [Verrucomicrobiales bacterium]|nr:hypothetical protein [Verrucomicrobiales bacterium]
MTKDEFLMFLKSGKRFEIQMGTTERRCTGCGGFGTTSGVDKTRCRLCYGRGIFHDPKMFTVFW